MKMSADKKGIQKKRERNQHEEGEDKKTNEYKDQEERERWSRYNEIKWEVQFFFSFSHVCTQLRHSIPLELRRFYLIFGSDGLRAPTFDYESVTSRFLEPVTGVINSYSFCEPSLL